MRGTWWLRWGAFAIAGLTSVNLLAAAPNERALRFHAALQDRPGSGYLFDRFYDTWLETGTLAALEAFLTERNAAAATVADQRLLARFYEKQGRYVEAVELLRSVTAEGEAGAEILYQKAQIEARTLDFETALADLAAAAALDPPGELAIDIAKLRGRLLVRDNQRAAALEVWQALLAAHPDDRFLFEDVIELQIDEGLLDEALATGQQLLKITTDPYRRVQYQLRLGDIQQRAGRPQEALALYAGTLATVGESTWLEREVLAQIGRVFRRDQDLTGWRDYLTQLSTQHPQRLTIRKQLAAVLQEHGETDAALAQWEEILAQVPGDRAAREEYVGLLVDAQRYDAAEQQLTALIEQYPADAELLMGLAEVQAAAERMDAAVVTLQRYVDVAGDDEFTLLRTARKLEQMEQPAAAEKMFDRLIAVVPDQFDARHAKAEFLYRQDRAAEARQLWQQLATTAAPHELLRIAQALRFRSEHAAAFDVLAKRRDALADDPQFLAELCRVALAAERADAVVAAAQRYVEVAPEHDFEAALRLAVQVVADADAVTTLLGQFDGQQNLSLGLQCLRIELLELHGDRAAVDAALAALPDDNDQALAQRARIYRQRQQWLAAAAVTRQRLELPDGQRSARVRELVDLYTRVGEYEQALDAIPLWRRLSPGSIVSWRREAALHQMLGRVEAALATLRTATQRFPDNVELLTTLAQSYVDNSRYDEAEHLYWRLYEQSTDLAGKLRWIAQLANLAQLRDQPQRLIDALNALRRDDRSDVVPYLALAEAHRIFDEYEERRQALMEAVRIRPDDLDLLLMLARLEENEGDYDRAISTLRRAAEIDPGDEAEQRLARLYLAIGEEEKGYRLLFELAGGEAMDADSVEAIGLTLAGNRNWTRLIEFLRPHLGRFAHDYRLRYLYGVALEEDLQPAAALATFAEVATVRDELTRRAPSPQQVPWGAYINELVSIAPSETTTLLEQQWISELAYAHAQTRRPGMMFGGGSGTSVHLPGSVDEARGFALAHLRALSGDLEASERERLAQRLSDAGVPLAAALLDMPSQTGPFEMFGPDFMDRHGDKPPVAALWTLMNATTPMRPDPERAREYHDRFVDRYPVLAFMAASMLVADDVEHEPTLTAALTALEEHDDSVGIFCAMATMSLLGADIGPPSQPVTLSAETRARLLEASLRWYPEIKRREPQMAMWLFMALRQTLGDAPVEQRIALLEQELADARQGTGRGTQQAMAFMRSHSGGETLIRPLTLPGSLPNLPMTVLSLFGAADGTFFGSQGEVDWIEDLAEHLDKVQDPVLKVLLADAAGHTAERDAVVKAMLAAERPTVTAHLIAAYCAAEAGEHGNARELLAAARFLPMQQTTRQLIDAAIVAYALEDLDDEAVQAQARAAALRLRRGALPPEQRMELVTVLVQLDLGEEAEQIANQAAQSFVSRSGGGFTQRQMAGPTAQLEQLLVDGKRDRVVKLVARELEQAAQSLLTASQGPMSMRHNNYGEDWQRFLTTHRLTDDVLARLEPPATANWLRQLRYGMACELLDRDTEARDAYGRALEDRPQETQVLVLVGLATASTDRATAVNYFQRIEARERPAAETLLAEQLQRRWNEDPQAALASCLATVEWLEAASAAPGDVPVAGDAFVPLVHTLASQTWSSNHNLPAVHSPAHLDRSQENRDLLVARRDLYRRLCRVLAESGGVTAPIEGFQRLHALAVEDGLDQEPFVALARQILERPPAKLPPGVAPATVYYMDSNEPTFRTPSEFLVRWAWSQESPDILTNEVLPAMRKAGRRDEAETLKHFQALFFCPADEFLAAAEAYIAATQRGPFGGMDTEGVVKVVEVWREREIPTLLNEFVLTQLLQRSGWHDNQAATAYLAALSKTRGRTAVQEFLEQAAEQLLGPAEERAALIEKHYQANQIRSGTINARLHTFKTLVESALDDPVTLFQVLPYYEQFAAHGDGRHFNWQVPDLVRNAVQSAGADGGQVPAMLAASPFVGPLETFRAIRLQDRYTGRTLLGLLLQELMRNERAKPAVAKWLADRPEQTFGVQLLRAGLQPGEVHQIRDFLGTQLEQLKKAPAVTQHDLAVLARAAAAPLADSKPATAEAMKLLHAVTQQAGQNRVAEVLAARRLADLEWEAYELAEKGPAVLRDAVRIDRDQAREVFDQLVTLSQSSRVQYGHRGGFPEDLLNQMLDFYGISAPASPEAFAFGFELLRDPDVSGLPIESDVVDALVNCADAIGRKHHTGGNNSNDQPTCCLIDICRELGPHLPEGDLTLLHPVLLGVFQRHGTGLYAPVLEATPPADEPATQRVFAELVHVAGLMEGQLEEAAVRERYAGILADTTLPARYRLPIAVFVARRAPGKMATHGAEAGIAILTAAYQAEAPLPLREALRELLRRFRYPRSDYTAAPVFPLAERSDAWKQQAAELLAAVRHNLRALERSHAYYSHHHHHGGALALPATLPPSFNLLALALELDDPEMARTLLKSNLLTTSTQLGAWALLIQYAEDELAADAIEAAIFGDFARWLPSEVYNDPQFNDRFAAVLEQLQDPAVRYAAEVAFMQAFAAAADSGVLNRMPRGAEPAKQATARLVELAQTFDTVTFPSEPARLYTLASLVRADDALVIVADAVAAAVSDRDIALLLSDESSRQGGGPWQSLARGRVRSLLLTGEAAALAELLASLGPASERDWSVRQFRESMLESVHRELQENSTRYDLATLAEFAPVFRLMIELHGERAYSIDREAVRLGLILHALGNNADHWWQAVAAIPDQARKERIVRHLSALRPALIRVITEREPAVDLETRLSLVEGLRLAEQDDLDIRRILALAGLRHDLFTDPELLANADRIAAAIPLNGATWAGLASVAKWDEKPALAETLMARALAHEAEGRDAYDIASALSTLHRWDEAEARTLAIRPTTPRLQSLCEKLLENIRRNRAAAEAAKEKRRPAEATAADKTSTSAASERSARQAAPATAE